MKLIRHLAGFLAALILPLSAYAADTTLVPTGLVQIEVGASEDSWGDKLNANATTLNALFDAGPALKVANGGTGSTTASGARTSLGLVIGTNIQAYDADLGALAGVTSAADRLPYFTGSATASVATYTAFARTLDDDADAATARTTLGLGTSATVATGTSGATIPLLNGNNTHSGSNAFTGKTGFGAPATPTVSSNTIAYTTANTIVVGGGTLNTITGGNSGDILFLRATSGTLTVSVATGGGAGSIYFNGANFSLNTSVDVLMLLSTGTFWIPVSFSNNE